MFNKTIAGVAVVAGALTLSGCAAPEAEFTLFEEVAKKCSSDGITVSDAGKTLSVDMMGETDWGGSSIYDVECVLRQLEVPTYVTDAMYNTTAMSGLQYGQFEVTLGGEGTDFAETVFNVDARWSFHPDNGLDATFHAKQLDTE